MNESMNCRQFSELLQAYLDRELEPADFAQFEAHAKACPECGRTLEEMTSILTDCAELDEGLEMPLAAQAAWRKAVREEAARRRKRFGFTMARNMGAIAAAFVVLVAGTLVVNRMPSLNQYPTEEKTAYPMMYADNDLEASGLQMEAMSDANAMVLLDGAGSRALQIDGAVEADMPMSALDEGATLEANIPIAPEGGAEPGLPKTEIKLIRSASRDIESSDYDADMKALKDLVAEYEGIIEFENAYGQKITPDSSSGRYAHITCRIPTASLDEFLSSLDAVGESVARSESSEDISMQYFDVETRLNGQKALRDRLQAMIASAESIEDMIGIESKLSEVQSEIEYMEGQLKGWNSRISYSTVRLSLSEVADKNAMKPINPTTLADRIKTSFTASINTFLTFLEDMMVFLVLVWPWLLILIIAIVIVCVVTRRRRGQ